MRGKSRKSRWNKFRGKISPFAKKKGGRSNAEASSSQKRRKSKDRLNDKSSQSEKDNPKDVKAQAHAKDIKDKDLKANDNDAKVYQKQANKTTEDKANKATEDKANKKTEDKANKTTEDKANKATEDKANKKTEDKANKKTEDKANKTTEDKAKPYDAKPQDKIKVDEVFKQTDSSSPRKVSTDLQQPAIPKKNSLTLPLSPTPVKPKNLEEPLLGENFVASKSKNEKAGSIGSFEDFDKVFASQIEIAAPKPILKPMSVTEIAYRKTSASSRLSRKSVSAGSKKSGGSKSGKPKGTTTVEILDLSTKQLLAIFSSIDYVWLEHSKYHTGSTPPNPYEYDVYSGLQQRILYIMPLFRKDEANVEVKRGLGFASTSYVIPPEFSCLTPNGEDMFHITCEVIQKCWGKPRINMDVIVKGNPLGKVTQKRRDISIMNRNGEEMVIIKDVPMPSKWVCSETSRPFTCKILKPEQARDPSVIGVIGRNGPDTKAVIFGQPLGFYFHLKGTGKESKKKINLDIASRVCLISALVGLMTTYVNRKQ